MSRKAKRYLLKRHWSEWVFSNFFPRCCPICDERISYGLKICDNCKEIVPHVKEPVCKKCGKQLENERQEYCGDCSRKKHCFNQGKALFSYQQQMKLSMYRFKYSNKREYADYFAEVAAQKYRTWIMYHGIEVIVPIPMYAKKKRKRGYNQAEVFAAALGQVLGIPVERQLIRRIKNTVAQKELNDKQRKDNLKGAFQVQTNIVKYRKILLVDDIYTTGTTIDAVAVMLKNAGVQEVYFLNICIGDGY